MKRYNFDEIIERKGTNCIKHDALDRFFGSSDVLPLWVADMDFKTPDFIVEAIRKRAEHEVFGYTYRPDSYFNSIINWMKRRHNWEIEREWISFSPGVVSALNYAIEAFTLPGDGIVVQPPVYFPFFDVVNETKRTLIQNPLIIENGRYTFDYEDLVSKIDANTRLLFLCNPQNPGGMVWRRDELEKLAEICLKNHIMIISDEIHADLVFKENIHIPISTISKEVAANCMICMAPSKTFNTAGFSSSVVIIPDKTKLVKYERALHVGHNHMGNIFGTVATEAAYTNGDVWLNQLIDYLWDNYLYLENFIKTRMPMVNVMKPEATYLIWLDFSAYGMNDRDLSDFFIKEAKVGLNNGGRFGIGGDGWMRINIGCPKSVLMNALERIYKSFN